MRQKSRVIDRGHLHAKRGARFGWWGSCRKEKDRRAPSPSHDILRRFRRANLRRVRCVHRHAASWAGNGHSKRHCRGMFGIVQLLNEPQHYLQGLKQFLAQRRSVHSSVSMELPVRHVVHFRNGIRLRSAADGGQVHHHGNAGRLGILSVQMGYLQTG